MSRFVLGDQAQQGGIVIQIMLHGQGRGHIDHTANLDGLVLQALHDALNIAIVAMLEHILRVGCWHTDFVDTTFVFHQHCIFQPHIEARPIKEQRELMVRGIPDFVGCHGVLAFQPIRRQSNRSVNHWSGETVRLFLVSLLLE